MVRLNCEAAKPLEVVRFELGPCGTRTIYYKERSLVRLSLLIVRSSKILVRSSSELLSIFRALRVILAAQKYLADPVDPNG